ncbi:hypothetical protein FQN57_001059 [Myotisia sp. PD_48]|nr:hypothetical protein FQN57_001059 [Myotisia sp. PD_48]
MSDTPHSGDEGAPLPTTTSTTSTTSTTTKPKNFPFVVHSNTTLSDDLPPRADNKAYTRQKRRRTSPEDHAILELEYRRNPKPDKVTRANIVSRVSLGDKEVQIWFQNRRQNDRRKSKPVQEQDPTSEGRIHSQEETILSQTSQPSSTQSPGDVISQCSIKSCNNTELPEQPAQPSTHSSQSHPHNYDSSYYYPPRNESISASQLSSGKRKRTAQGIPEFDPSFVPASPPALRLSFSYDGEAVVRQEDEQTPSPPKTRDSLRIAFSADGEAVVRTANELSPSRKQPSPMSSAHRRMRTLHRSSSGISLGCLDARFGRSRDSRNWELYCDTDARSAFSLAHSSSRLGCEDGRKSGKSLNRQLSDGSRIFAPRTSLPNETIPNESYPHPQKRKKLSRTMSSLGRLESDSASLHASKRLNMSQEPRPPRKVGSKLNYHSGDSDKENWLPGTQSSATRESRAQPTASTRPQPRVLRETRDTRREGNRQLGRTTKRGGNVNDIINIKLQNRTVFDENGKDVSSEVISGSRSNQVEDLDCIQGLLSLSQGAWR